MKKIIILAVYFISAHLCIHANDIQTIKKNYIQLLLSENKSEKDLINILITDPKESYFSDQMVVELMDRYSIHEEEIKSLLNNLLPDGSWSDIDYKDQNRSGWQPKKHIERLLLLTKSYCINNSAFYQSHEVENAIHKAFNYWFGAKLVSPNWWYNQIGIPKALGAILVLFEEKLSQYEKDSIIKLMDQAKFGMTGQNKVWLAGNVLIKAVMKDDFKLVKQARDTIFSEIHIGSGEGIKPDNSFHQHGAQLQFGNYGAAYIASMGMWSQVLAGTSIALDQSRLDILSFLINQGYRRILWKGNMDINALGRQFFKQAQRHKALSVGFSTSMLSDSDKKNSDKYKLLLRENFYNPSSQNTMTGLYHFWMSDLTVQRRLTWMASVKMSSLRVIGAEAGNGDNLKGYYLADGALYTYTNGDEYSNIFPCWDWRKIPGVTCYETDDPLKQLYWGGYHNNSTFVGNVNDGKTGITSMILDRDGLRAHKSWIFTDDFILCLGAGIKSDSGYVVTTSIDQRLKSSDLLRLKGRNWIKTSSFDFSKQEDTRFFHYNTGYIVIQPDKGKANIEKRTGKWKEIMNMYPENYSEEKEIISLWVDHGKDPQNGSYQYFILPSSTKEKVKQFNTKEIKVISNTKQLQAVTIDNITYAAAYPLIDMVLMEGMHLKSTNTGLFMIEKEETRVKVTIVDPTQTQQFMDITMNGITQTIQLPSGEEKGTPVITYFKLDTTTK